MLLIIDNQSSFIKRFKREFLSDQNFPYVFFDHNQPLIIPSNIEITGLILSGGKGNPYEPLNLTSNFVALMNFDVPVLGFCLGHEIIAAAYRGRIRKMAEPQNKRQEIQILNQKDPIFKGIKSKTIVLKEKHSFYVSELPTEFESLAESDICPNEIIRHKSKLIYGFQSHPEVSADHGITMVSNFLEMCGFELTK